MNYFLELSDYEDFNARNKIYSLSIDWLATLQNLATETSMKKVKPVVTYDHIEVLSFENCDFITLMVHFCLPIYHVFNTGNKSNEFSKEQRFTSRRLAVATWMKKLNFVFFEKSDLQHQGCLVKSELFGIPAMWGSEINMFQKINFRSWLVFFDVWETRRAKQTAIKKVKLSFQIFSFSFEFFSKLFFNFFSAFLEVEGFSRCFEKAWKKTICLSDVENGKFWEN